MEMFDIAGLLGYYKNIEPKEKHYRRYFSE